jgi:GxxExxY protein
MDSVSDFARTVFDELGPGHSEAVYHEAMEVMFRSTNTPYASEVVVPIIFMGKGIGFHRLDTVLYVDPKPVILEYKCIARLKEQEENQVRAYLRATGYAYGVLINFGGASPEIRRVELKSALSA